MKVVLATAGRFHMFALARELERRGALERIYSGFPWFALAREGLPRGKVRTFPWVRTLLMAGGRPPLRLGTDALDWLHNLSLTTLDAYVRSRLPACELFVGHEGAGLWSGAEAKRRGGRYVCDRGCTHIGWKEELLREEYNRVGLKWPGRTRSHYRELAEYDAADLIVVPSNFARESFRAKGFAASKLAVVPYGVNLDVFAPVERPRTATFEVLFVGALSVRKGAHDLMAAFKALEVPSKRLTIAGVVSGDILASLRADLSASDVRLLGPVPHLALKQIMGASDVLVLPSVEEGLALVLAEALACGCPVIASANTGAADLIAEGREGFIVPIRSPETITERLQRLAQSPDLQRSMSQAALAKAQAIGGWRDYGDAMMGVYGRLLRPSAPPVESPN